MSQNTGKPYKLIIKGILTQKTAFSTGGNAPDDNNIDMPLAKDGKGRYTIRGTGLAGALIATARQLYDLSGQKQITEGTPQQQYEKNQLRLNESVWIFHHAHLKSDPDFDLQTAESPPEIRDNVAIRQKTGAAMDGAKFDTEILPAGTQWDFLMEVDEYRDRDENKSASAIALNALAQWQQGCWLGRDVARGLGWMQLEQMEVYRLCSEQVSLWPNADEKPLDTIKKLDKYKLFESQILAIKGVKPPKPQTLTGTITITVGEGDDNAYGLDFLSVGGNNNIQESKKGNIREIFTGKQFDTNRYLKPLGQRSDNYFKFERDGESNPDFSLAVTEQDGKIVPHIPGASIRGILRHSLSWLLRHNGNDIWEPGGENSYPENENNDIVLQLFGSTQRSAALLISDALLKQDGHDNWQAVILEMHAEDEFTQGVYGSSKFNHTCLVKGSFVARYHLTLDGINQKDKDKDNARKAISKLQKLAEHRMLPLGSGQWKGLGWVKWKITPDEPQAVEQQGEQA